MLHRFILLHKALQFLNFQKNPSWMKAQQTQLDTKYLRLLFLSWMAKVGTEWEGPVWTELERYRSSHILYSPPESRSNIFTLLTGEFSLGKWTKKAPSILIVHHTVLCKAVLSRVACKTFYSLELFLHVLCPLRWVAVLQCISPIF